jgi:hypothetical protein
MVLALPLSASAEDRLVVEDGSAVETFIVQDDGSVYSAGNVGIGTQSPNYQFEVEGNSALQVLTRFYDSLASNSPGLLFQRAKGTQSSPADIEAGTYLGKLQFRGKVGSNYLNYGYFALVADDTNQNGYYTFQDAGKNDRLIIETTGNVGIGTSNPTELLMVGSAYCNGSTWENASSRELKKNIRDLTTDEANQALKKLAPVKFNYKTDEENEEYVGFIAEDVPELVASHDRKGLGPMDIVAVLTKVVQEQQETIAELTKKIDLLERHATFRSNLAWVDSGVSRRLAE